MTKDTHYGGGRGVREPSKVHPGPSIRLTLGNDALKRGLLDE